MIPLWQRCIIWIVFFWLPLAGMGAGLAWLAWWGLGLDRPWQAWPWPLAFLAWGAVVSSRRR